MINKGVGVMLFLSISFQVVAQKRDTLKEFTVKSYKVIKGMGQMNAVNEGVIYAGKKNEVIVPDSLDANTSQNNPRQVLGRIPGANYSETQGSGFPSNGIGFRGLNPSQSIETNTRQNGYNLAADLYGYSEAYYVTPLEAVDRVEVTRGAASLQFGPQFGGVVNYVIKDGDRDKKIAYGTEETAGSFGFYNTYHSMGGQVGKVNYMAFVQYQGIQGWRPNSDYRQLSGFGKISYQVNDRFKVGLEYTLMRNRIHMPGGFDDEQFNQNSQASYRARNWLESPWNILAVKGVYQFSDQFHMYVTCSYMSSARNLVWKNEDGGPEVADSIVPATGQYVNREVQREIIHNFTTEVRFLKHFDIGGRQQSLSFGARYFTGTFKREGGGLGTTGSNFDLTLLDPHYEYNLDFTTTNLAPFAEQLFRVGEKLLLTAGMRFEYIRNTAKGYTTDSPDVINVSSAKKRYVPLFGVGAQYVPSPSTSIYSNFTQAYSPVTYDQLTPYAVASKIDPNMKDANGYNADLGWRGVVAKCLHFDVGLFYMAYNNRIGLEQLKDAQGKPYTYRTNVANSVHKGMESYIEFFPKKCFSNLPKWLNISMYNSLSLINARYVSGAYKGNSVEYAPDVIERFGITYALAGFSTTFNGSYTSQSFGDASNVALSTDPVAGKIPGFVVFDWSCGYKFHHRYNIKSGINNLTDARYFTKRTDEYPGPGIIPAIGRSFYVGVGARF